MNTLKEQSAFQEGSTFNAKIRLPVLKDNQVIKKVGVFASRSPHRPNPIGITLARIRSVDMERKIVYLNACDLVNGTPVYDIKPYVPAYDAVDDCHIPYWIRDTIHLRNEVSILPSCAEKVHSLQSQLYQYRYDAEEYIAGLMGSIAADIRSRNQTNKLKNNWHNKSVKLLFDETVVQLKCVGDRSFQILDVDIVEKAKGVDAMRVETEEGILDEEMNNSENKTEDENSHE